MLSSCFLLLLKFRSCNFCVLQEDLRGVTRGGTMFCLNLMDGEEEVCKNCGVLTHITNNVTAWSEQRGFARQVYQRIRRVVLFFSFSLSSSLSQHFLN